MSLLKFPILANDDRAYLDNAATSLMTEQAIEAMVEFEVSYRSNVARGIYPWAERATEAYEAARGTVAQALGAKSEEVIFTSGTTASLNMAASFVLQLDQGKDGKVLVTEMEHHSNIVPWQLRFGKRDCVVWAECDDKGVLDEEALKARLEEGDVTAVAISHASNVTGVVNDVKAIAAVAHANGALVVVDGAQYIPHDFLDPRKDLDADFYAFSGHKCNGPTGVGVLWGRSELLEQLRPVFGGGGMVVQVKEQATTFVDPPHRFEAGTPNVAGAIGLGAVLALRDELEQPGWEEIRQGLDRLDARVLEEIGKVKGIQVLGPEAKVARVPIRSFNIEGFHPHDVCQVLALEGVYVRGGHHCAMPLMRRLGVDACVRVSLGPHVSDDDVDRLARALAKVAPELG